MGRFDTCMSYQLPLLVATAWRFPIPVDSMVSTTLYMHSGVAIVSDIESHLLSWGKLFCQLKLLAHA